MKYDFRWLTSRFNDSLKFPKRQAFYNELKRQKLLGKVFGVNEQSLLREYLFTTENGESWPDRKLFDTNVLERLEEQRVNFFFHKFFERRSISPHGRINKERQLYALLVELDRRIELQETGYVLVAYAPISLVILNRLVDYLRRGKPINESALREAGFRNPARTVIIDFLGQRPKPEERPAKQEAVPTLF